MYLPVYAGFHASELRRELKYSLQIRLNAKYDVHRNIFDKLISLSQKEYFILYNEYKIAFHFNKGRFIAPLNQRFRLKKRHFFIYAM